MSQLSMIQSVLFDLAGTVADFGSRAPVAAFQRLFKMHGLSVPITVIRRHMGMEKREHIRHILAEEEVAETWRKIHGGDATDQDIERLYAELEPVQRTAATSRSELVPGFVEVALHLEAQGVQLGFNTGYSRFMAQPILDELQAHGVKLGSVVCASEVSRGRPAPDMNLLNLAELEAAAGRSVVVDDSLSGMAAGRNAGLWTVGVSASGNTLGLSLSEWTALPKARQAPLRSQASRRLKEAGAHFVIDTVADLEDCLGEIDSRLSRDLEPEAA